jgi:hypothetical protein
VKITLREFFSWCSTAVVLACFFLLFYRDVR